MFANVFVLAVVMKRSLCFLLLSYMKNLININII